ncbi:MAG: hypothetical protein WDN24_05330 [Sphingomonas sp.]
MRDMIAGLPRWAVLPLVALAGRALTFGNPALHVDEAFYLEVSDAMLRGAMPYVDVWDRKPIGLFLLYALPAFFGVKAGIWIYQAMALACVVATALGIARLADRAGWSKGAVWAGIAYLVWLNLLEGQGGQAPVFYNLLTVCACLLAAPRADDAARPGRRFFGGLGAMALVGLAIQVKYSVVFEGLFLGLWLMWREWRLGRSALAVLPLGAAWAAAALAPTGAAWAAFAATGHGDAFVFANFTSILARRPDPLLEQLGNLFKILLLTSPLIAMGVLSWLLPLGQGNAQVQRRFLFGWLIAAALGLLLFGSWFDHYALPLLAPLAACAAGFIGDHRDGRRWALPALALFFLGGHALMATKLHNRGTPAEYYRLVETVGRGPGCLYVYSGPPLLYSLTGRCHVSRYIFPSHLGRLREAGAIGVDSRAEIRRILTEKPAVVVVRPPYHGEYAEMRALVLEEMKRSYGPPRQVTLGLLEISVYRRK